MIFTDRTIIVQKGTSSINDTIILYRGDKEVEIRFTLNEGSPFKFGSGASPNIIEKTEATYGQLVIKTPGNLPPIFSEVAPTIGGKIIFTITAEMIDEITEIGNYTFQIRLLDDSMESRATLPEVKNGIEIREPIALEDISSTNEVEVATVGYALTTSGVSEDAFDAEGNYNKTTWGTGDRITAAKLNKMEAGIDGVNKKIASGGTGGNVDLSNYVTKETGNANQITFSDGQTFQAKLDAGILKGDKGDKGEDGLNLINQNGGGVLKIWAGTKVEYDALLVKDKDTVYLVEGSGGGSTTVTTYTITNNLTNCINSNANTSVDKNSSYTATISANDGYTLSTVTVTMGGSDITSTAYSNGNIVIESVSGNIVITASATATSSGGDTSEVTWAFGTTNSAGGIETSSDSVVSSKIAVQPSTTYHITVSPNGTATVPIIITEYNSNENYVTRTLNSYTITTNASTAYLTVDIRGGVTSLDNITINITNNTGAGTNSGLVYTLENELILDGTGAGIVNTGKGLFDADRDFTIFADFTPDGSMTCNGLNQQAVFRVKQTASPWIGVDISLYYADEYASNPNESKGNLAGSGLKNGIYLGKMVTGVSSQTTDRCKFAIKRVASEQKMYFYDKDGLIGSYNDSGTVANNLFDTTVIIGYGNGSSLYFSGTIHQFKIWYDAINDNDITSMLV